MPRSRKPTALSSLLGHVVEDLGVSRRLDEAHIEERWRRIAGPQADRVTRKVRMSGDVLTVYLTDATWRHALHAERIAWKDRLNEAIGQTAVSEIVFR